MEYIKTGFQAGKYDPCYKLKSCHRFKVKKQVKKLRGAKYKQMPQSFKSA